jgi:putative endonuclease
VPVVCSTRTPRTRADPLPPGADPRGPLGRRGEALAASHMSRRGFTIVARNERTRYGEIDLIACDGAVLAFVEVKTRQAHPGGAWPEPLAGLRPTQRARLRRLAAAWLAGEVARPRAGTIRFDAVGVVLDHRGRLLRLDHVEGAW